MLLGFDNIDLVVLILLSGRSADAVCTALFEIYWFLDFGSFVGGAFEFMLGSS